MEEQSDTPRVDAVLRSFRFIAHTDRAAAMWLDTVINIARDLDRELTTATRERDEARAEVEGLRSALGFYSQPVRYDGPNQRPIPGDPYTAADSAYMNDVCRDGGEIAREALAATEAEP